MKYKYKKNQLFGKKLDVPKDVLNRIYGQYLSFQEYIEYDLQDKIPFSCLKEQHRKIITKYGLEKAKTIDWELIDKHMFKSPTINFDEVLGKIDASTENINESIYNLVIDELNPSDYSTEMKKLYSDRFVSAEETDQPVAYYFNEGRLSLNEILKNWSLFKNKNFSFNLKNDKQNTNNLSYNEIKSILEKNEIIPFLVKKGNDAYTLINNCKQLSEDEQNEIYIKLVDEVVQNDKYAMNNITNEEFKAIFKHYPFKEFVQHRFPYIENIDSIINELSEENLDYIYNLKTPLSSLINVNVLSFICEYGLNNIIDFDKNCGGLFTENNCSNLQKMYDRYLHYGADEEHSFRTRNRYDENGNYVNKPYTKEEFYEAIRRMIIYGPTDYNYVDDPMNYQTITGEFKEKNEELFLPEDAPEELKRLFYKHSLTNEVIANNQNYIPYLENKDLSCYFKKIYIEAINGNHKEYTEFYSYMKNKTDFKTLMSFITNYNVILDSYRKNQANNRIVIQENATLEQIEHELNIYYRKQIIENKLKYDSSLPEQFQRSYPDMFFDDKTPEHLKVLLHNRELNFEYINTHVEEWKYIKQIDPEILYEYTEIQVSTSDNTKKENLIAFLKQKFDYEECLIIMSYYGKYMDMMKKENDLNNLHIPETLTRDELCSIFDEKVYNLIKTGKASYDETISPTFKEKYKNLFLPENTPEQIKNKFYNRELSIEDLGNQEILKYFNNTDISYGFNTNSYWIRETFKNNSIIDSNIKKIKLFKICKDIDDVVAERALQEYMFSNFEDKNKTMENINIEEIKKILMRVSHSNSSELIRIRGSLIEQLLLSKNPLEKLSAIEDMFLRNNIPNFGKVYFVFETLHPNYEDFNFNSVSKISPVLKSKSSRGKNAVIFADLIKSSFGSNNHSVKEYLSDIENGNKLFQMIRNNPHKYNELNEESKVLIATFCKHLEVLYNNTLKGKTNPYVQSGSIIEDINEFNHLFSENGNMDYNLDDRIVKMFCFFAGINTLQEAKQYIDTKISTADKRNRQSVDKITLKKGDFIKGIGQIKYLKNILQNGSVSKEYLGSSAESDNTPLDTDVSMVINEGKTIEETLSHMAAKSYGPIWLALKNNDRFIMTRDQLETVNLENTQEKLEVFYSGKVDNTHYGIRTGFASSEIDYFIVRDNDPRLGLEIAMNGFYIPVVNMQGKVLFTPEDYDNIRKKMTGLSYYGKTEYEFSNNLITSETNELVNQIANNSEDVKKKKEIINRVIKKSLEELNLKLKTTIDGDLTEGIVELIDTGSTGRGTNKPGDGDFDYMMRLDKTIMSDPEKQNQIKKTILKNLGKENSQEITSSGDFRLKEIVIDDIKVDIDITFTEKTDKLTYSTDMSLQDRLETIKKQDSEKYEYVIANILFAKKVLKDANAYKPYRSDNTQGGLGGVGIENWILQNGGSFIDAANSFLKASKDKTFDEFKETYQIWDFGENHLAEKKGFYPHDDFVCGNMSENGYNKMKESLQMYMNELYNNKAKIVTK